MSKGIGWISLHRSIQNHWLYEEDRKFSKFEAWIDLLLMVNHKDNKTIMDGKLFTVKRGQRITSLRKLGERWTWSLTKVDSFLKLLEKDKMIVLKKDTKKTLITIVNYEVYQNEDIEKRHRKDSEKTEKEQRKDTEKTEKETNNNVNKVNNENNDNNPHSVSDEDFKKIVEYYQRTIGALNAIDFNYLSQDIDKFGKGIVCKAIQEAGNNSAKRYKYINTLLVDWANNGVKTKEDAERYLSIRNRNLKNKSQKKDEYHSPYQDMEFKTIPDESLPF